MYVYESWYRVAHESWGVALISETIRRMEILEALQTVLTFGGIFTEHIFWNDHKLSQTFKTNLLTSQDGLNHETISFLREFFEFWKEEHTP